MSRIPYRNDNHITHVEWRVRKMLLRMRVWFRHRAFVAGREVDFLIPRPGKRGLLVEVDGDIYHLDPARREARDGLLRSAGWDVVHFWGSEVLDTPDHVRQALEAALTGVPKARCDRKGKPHERIYCDECDLDACLNDSIPGRTPSRGPTMPLARLRPTS